MKAQHPWWRVLRAILAFVVFAAVYAYPIWPSGLAAGAPNREVEQGLRQALSTPAVLLGLAQNLLTHLGLLALLCVALAGLSRGAAAALRLRPMVATALTFTSAWIWLVAFNAFAFEHSRYSLLLPAIAHPAALALSSVVLAVLLGATAWVYRTRLEGRTGRIGAAAVATGCLLLAGANWNDSSANARSHSQRRDIIIIGIDSLSAPLLQREAARLPSLSALLAQSTRYEQAYTPLGRTYPAWVSILSGRSPAQHGALYNLRGLEHAEHEDLLTTSLRAQGYRTVYAIDERRFNNIDETFGFDSVIGPRTGVLDFVLQPFNDTPLTNLLLQTRAGQWLLPYSHLNVASVANYDARGFVEEISRASSASGAPLFLAVHFLSGHFPFDTRHATLVHSDPNAMRAHHIEALTAVDVQVGQLMATLARQHRLDDTLVVVLSDHGEALGEAEPVQLANGELHAASSFGHGSDLLSEHQNRIVLGVARFLNGKPVAPAPARNMLVSLLDIRGTAEAFARDASTDIQPSSACIDVETELRLPAAADYRTLDMRKVAAEGVGLYEIDSQGRLKLKEALMAELVAKKDVGLRCSDRLTVFKPADGSFRAYHLAPGAAPRQAQPLLDDMAHIQAYRNSLLNQGARATAAARRGAGT